MKEGNYILRKDISEVAVLVPYTVEYKINVP